MPTQPEGEGSTPVLDDPLHNQVCSEVTAAVNLTEDASSLGLLEPSKGGEEESESPPDYKDTLRCPSTHRRPIPAGTGVGGPPSQPRPWQPT